MLKKATVRVISSDLPAPRLLNTVAPELRDAKAGPSQPPCRSRLKGVSIFSGNGRAIFIGILLGAPILLSIGIVYNRHQSARRSEEGRRQFLAVATQSVSSPNLPEIKIDADALRVTAISLGNPRLALVNGQQVSEGDYVIVHTSSLAIAAKLRVLKISDGRIELSNGTQVIAARLEIPSAPLQRP